MNNKLLASLKFIIINMLFIQRIHIRKGKALRKHSLHGQISASLLLMLFNNGILRCYNTLTL